MSATSESDSQMIGAFARVVANLPSPILLLSSADNARSRQLLVTYREIRLHASHRTAIFAAMIKTAFVLVAMLCICVFYAQAQAPVPNANAQEVLIGCVPQGDQPLKLALEDISSKGLTPVNLTPIADEPIEYVLVFDKSKNALAHGKAELTLSRLLLHSLMRPGKDIGSLVLFDAGVLAARGYTTNPDEILASLEKIRPGESGFSLLDAIAAAAKKLDEMGTNRPRMIIVVASKPIEREDYSSDASSDRTLALADLLISSHTLLVAAESFSLADAAADRLQRRLNNGGMVDVATPIGKSPYQSGGAPLLDELSGNVGGRLLRVSSESESDILKQSGKDLDRLAAAVHSLYWLRLQPREGSQGVVRLNLKAKAHCTLLAPSQLRISITKPQ